MLLYVHLCVTILYIGSHANKEGPTLIDFDADAESEPALALLAQIKTLLWKRQQVTISFTNVVFRYGDTEHYQFGFAPYYLTSLQLTEMSKWNGHQRLVFCVSEFVILLRDVSVEEKKERLLKKVFVYAQICIFSVVCKLTLTFLIDL